MEKKEIKGKSLTHVHENNQAGIVDISDKSVSKRTAVARSEVWLGAEIATELSMGEIQTKKGPVFQTAIIAGTMAAKKTSELIPFCHPVGLDNCKIRIEMEGETAVIYVEASVTAKTGVEMEALTAASVAALTVYDMCKAMSHDIQIKNTCLVSKTGGKTDFQRHE